jgi:hypothetical protein
MYFLLIPLTVAVVRYLFVAQNEWVTGNGVNYVVDRVLFWTFFTSFFVTLFSQFPVTDFKNGPYNHCIGRFEIYFDPKSMDPITPGKF